MRALVVDDSRATMNLSPIVVLRTGRSALRGLRREHGLRDGAGS